MLRIFGIAATDRVDLGGIAQGRQTVQGLLTAAEDRQKNEALASELQK
jgi:hypothetical protein